MSYKEIEKILKGAIAEEGINEDRPVQMDIEMFSLEERKNGKIRPSSYLIIKALMKAKILEPDLYQKFGLVFSGNKLFQDILKLIKTEPYYTTYKDAEDESLYRINQKWEKKIEVFKKAGNHDKIKELKEARKKEEEYLKNIDLNAYEIILTPIISSIRSLYECNTSFKNKCVQIFKKHLPVYEKKFNNNFTSRRLNKLIHELNLNKTQQTILEYLLLFRYDSTLYEIITGYSRKKINESMHHLTSIGILTEKGMFSSITMEYIRNRNKKLSELIFKNNEIKNNKNVLEIEDYPESMKKDIEYIIKLIKNHKDNRPLNVLLYGIAGSGKSSLVDLLHKAIPNRKFFNVNFGMKIAVEIKRHDKEKDESMNYDSIIEDSSAKERMRILSLCDKISLKNQFVFIMDECDDVLNSSQGSQDKWLTGKKEINELLQALKVPVIWITNHKNKVDASTFRRFQYSIKFEQLSFKQRKKIWEKQIEINKAENLCKNLDLEYLSYKYNVTPGIINNVIEQLVSLKPNKKEVKNICEDLLKSYCELIDIQETEEFNKPENDKYDISGLNIDSNFKLEQILQSLHKFSEKLLNKENKNKNLNVLLEGLPGTGKTEFAKYISRYLKMPLIYKNYGDLASCWVGETEHNIAKVFKEAEETNSILFLDEADSLFTSRERASHSWEVTEVNEILTRMERFNGIFIASTNFIDNLDNASMRRFAFKIKFKTLDNEGKIIFMKRFFNIESKNYDELNKLENVTPGDFKAVRDRLSYMDIKPDYDLIINELKDEIKYKHKNNRIGF